MSELRTIFEVATDRIEVDLEAASLAEAHRRRRRTRAIVAMAAAACVVLVVAGINQLGSELRADQLPTDRPPSSDVTPPTSGPTQDTDGLATQPLWNPFDLEDAPRSSIAFTGMLGGTDRLEPDIEHGANPVEDDPMAGVVVAWAEKGAGVRLLGTDGRWRSAPEEMESNQDNVYQPGPPAISSDGTSVATATIGGLRILDVTTGEVTTLPWPDAIERPWDSAPGLRWLPNDEGFLVLHWNGPLVIGLDGETGPAPYPTPQNVSDVFGIDPAGPVYQNYYPRNTLQTWEDGEVVQEVPFPQCERLTASYGLVACTTGAIETYRSGPVVVDAATGEIVGYAPVRDPNAFYSDNGYLTTLGFLDPDTVVMAVRPRATELAAETWHLVAWQFREGTFERIATGEGTMWSVSVAPALMD